MKLLRGQLDQQEKALTKEKATTVALTREIANLKREIHVKAPFQKDRDDLKL
jgi:cell division protein FtsB